MKMAKTIEVSDETYEKIKDQLSTDEVIDISDMQDFVGKKIFVRLATNYLVGKVEKVVGNLVFLSKASWIADTGRFSNAIKGESDFDEVEPVGDWFFSIKALVDGGFWKHKLPTKQK